MCLVVAKYLEDNLLPMEGTMACLKPENSFLIVY